MALNITGDTLDTIPPPTAPLDLGSQPIENLSDPTNPQDGATKNYVDTNIPTVPTIASTTDLLAGNGSGNAVDSGLTNIPANKSLGVGTGGASGLALGSEVLNYSSNADYSSLPSVLSGFLPVPNMFISANPSSISSFGVAGVAYGRGVSSYTVGGYFQGITIDGVSAASIDGDAYSSGSTNTDTLYGCFFTLKHVSTGTLSNQIGVYLDFQKDAGAGVINQAYGLKLNDVNTAVTNYAISTGLGTVSFGDSCNAQMLSMSTRPTVSAVIPANFSAVVVGGAYTLLSGKTLTLASGAIFKIE